MNCAKTDESIEMPFGMLTLVGPRNHVLDGSQNRTNQFVAARGNKSAMRPFAELLRTLVSIITARRYASAVYAVVVCPVVRPSVRLSVCHTQYCTKTVKPRIMLITPYDSPGTLVF